jgi:hypothetical protein
MKKITILGTVLFLLGLVIISVFPVFVDGDSEAMFGIRVSYVLMALGGVLILGSLVKERIQDDKNLKKIKKEDLEP